MLTRTFRALRHPNYRLYFAGQVVSLVGTWVQIAALGWLAYAVSGGQSRWPAMVAAAQVLPTFFLGAWGGGLADRWPRRSLILCSQSAMLGLALVLVGLVSFDALTPRVLLTVALLIGVVNAIDTPARLAFLIDLVPRDDVLNAVALNSLAFNVARAAGPALAGWLLPALGFAACFLINAVTFLAVLAALAVLRLPPPAAARREPGSLLDGLRYLAARPPLLVLLGLAGALAFFGWPLAALLPAVADRQLDAGERGYAWMLSGIGGGALGGALVVAAVGSAARPALLLAAGVGVGAAALLGVAAAAGLPAAVAWCAASGAGLILFFATGQAVMQLGAGEHNRGRVLGIWLMVLSAAQPAGNLLAGWLADAVGVTTVLRGQAAGIVLVALLVLPFAWRPRSYAEQQTSASSLRGGPT